jgi:hypothetical protein
VIGRINAATLTRPARRADLTRTVNLRYSARPLWALFAATSASLALCAPALAASATKSTGDLTQTFKVDVPKIKPTGAYSFKLSWTTLASGGLEVAPAIADVELKLPKNLEIERRYLRGRYFCDVAKLKAQRSTSACARSSLIGTGTATLDFRPFTGAAVSATIGVFLARGDPGAAAKLAILAVPNPDPFVDANPIVAQTKPVLEANVYDDAGGPYNYRVALPADIDAPVLVSVKEFTIDVQGPGRGARWLTLPCQRKASFAATFSYVGGTALELGVQIKRPYRCERPKPKKRKRNRR